MNSATLILLCFTSMLCLGPPTFYLCWLSSVNRRPYPTIVSGPWDFARVLAALAGFFLVGCVVLLNLVESDSRFLGRGSFEQLQNGWENSRLAWMLVAVGYFALLVGLGALTIRSRQNSICIYNVDPIDLDRSIDTALERSGFQATRKGNTWKDDSKPLVAVRPFHGTQFAQVQLLTSNAPLREEIERHLRAILDTTPSPENPSAGWFTSLATAGVIVLLGILLLTSYLMFFKSAH